MNDLKITRVFCGTELVSAGVLLNDCLVVADYFNNDPPYQTQKVVSRLEQALDIKAFAFDVSFYDTVDWNWKYIIPKIKRERRELRALEMSPKAIEQSLLAHLQGKYEGILDVGHEIEEGELSRIHVIAHENTLFHGQFRDNFAGMTEDGKCEITFYEPESSALLCEALNLENAQIQVLGDPKSQITILFLDRYYDEPLVDKVFCGHCEETWPERSLVDGYICPNCGNDVWAHTNTQEIHTGIDYLNLFADYYGSVSCFECESENVAISQVTGEETTLLCEITCRDCGKTFRDEYNGFWANHRIRDGRIISLTPYVVALVSGGLADNFWVFYTRREAKEFAESLPAEFELNPNEDVVRVELPGTEASPDCVSSLIWRWPALNQDEM